MDLCTLKGKREPMPMYMPGELPHPHEPLWSYVGSLSSFQQLSEKIFLHVPSHIPCRLWGPHWKPWTVMDIFHCLETDKRLSEVNNTKLWILGGRDALLPMPPPFRSISLYLLPQLLVTTSCIAAFLCSSVAIGKGWDFSSMLKTQFQEPKGIIRLVLVTLSVHVSTVLWRF